jgi:hypothetical protein
MACTLARHCSPTNSRFGDYYGCTKSLALGLAGLAPLKHSAVQFAGTTQLAALGPTSVIFSFAAYVFNALAISTTTVISKHLAANDDNAACEAATTSLLTALLCGIVTLTVMQVLVPISVKCHELTGQASVSTHHPPPETTVPVPITILPLRRPLPCRYMEHGLSRALEL